MGGGAGETDHIRMTLDNGAEKKRAGCSLHDQGGRNQARRPSLGGAAKRAAYNVGLFRALVLCFALCVMNTTAVQQWTFSENHPDAKGQRHACTAKNCSGAGGNAVLVPHAPSGSRQSTARSHLRLEGSATLRSGTSHSRRCPTVCNEWIGQKRTTSRSRQQGTEGS